MPDKEKVEHPVSAGGVVYKEVNGKLEVVLCGRESPPLWALPKGTPDAGETIEETALREVQEETGLEVDIQASLGSIEYWFVRSQDGVRCHKTVHFFLMVSTGGAVSLHDPEFDYVRWFSESEVCQVMTHADEVAVMVKALSLARSEPVPS